MIRFASRRFLLPLALAATLTACATQREAVNEPANQVAAATANWRDAYNSRNPQLVTALYDPDAVLWGTQSRMVATTPQEIAAYFADIGQRPLGRVSIGGQHIRVYGDTAFNTGSYTFTDVRDGENTLRSARFTFVFHKVGGVWKIVSHHSSTMPQ